jgi:sporulation protein YlmC with PRC-barrel domain
MTYIATALFGDYARASKAVQDLENAGVSYRDISVVSNAKAHPHLVPVGTTDDAVSGTGVGAAIGVALGGSAGALAGLGLLTIPGFGPLAAAGWIAAMAVGAAAGGAAGGMAGLLVGAGMSDEDAKVYAEGVQKGGTLVVVRIEAKQYDEVQSILSRSAATDMAAHTALAGKSETAEIEEAHVADALAAREHKPGMDSTSPVIKADRVKGTSVYDVNGKHIGTVKRLMIEKLSGRVAYVVMSVGSILSLEDDVQSIPWTGLTYDTHLQGYRTRIRADQVRSAPVFSRAAEWEWTDDEKHHELHRHYGVASSAR